MPRKPTEKELATNVAAKLNKIGDITAIPTDIITAVKAAQLKADQAFQSASDGKIDIAVAITGKGVQASGDDTFLVLAEKITQIPVGTGGDGTTDGTALAQDLRWGKIAYSQSTRLVGTLPERGAGQTLVPDTTDHTFLAGIYSSPIIVKGDANLRPENILLDVPIFNTLGTHVCAGGIDTSDATAIANEILSGKTAYVNGVKVTGAMPNKGAVVITPTTENQVIPEGYHDGTGYVAGATGGLDTSDATAYAMHLLSGKTAYARGTKITGNMTDYGAKTITPGTTGQSFGSGYYSSITVYGDADLTAANIKQGVNIFGIAGACASYRTKAYITGLNILNGATYTVTGLTFKPGAILIRALQTTGTIWDAVSFMINSSGSGSVYYFAELGKLPITNITTTSFTITNNTGVTLKEISYVAYLGADNTSLW